MLNFKELPEDGTAFEQFVREILLILQLDPHWTGKGPDQGRDMVIIERAQGAIAPLARTWLVQCKHNAHSGASVGRDELVNIVDSCKQVGALGYLLACSTQPSAGLVTKLREIEEQSGIVMKVWDGVHFEKLLMEPRCFALGHLFFPNSFAATPWRLYNSGEPNRWTAHYRDYFLVLNNRIAGRHPRLDDCEKIIGMLEKVGPLAEHEYLRPRAIYFDDKNENYTVYVDYLVAKDREPSLKPSNFEAILHDGCGLYHDEGGQWYMTFWDVQIKKILPHSDHFAVDHAEFYTPEEGTFQSGTHRVWSVGDLADMGDFWRSEL